MPASAHILKVRAQIGHTLLMSPGVTAIIFNDQSEILLQHRSDNGYWGILGGAIDPDEDPAEAVVREVWEEAGLRVIPERIIGVYGGRENHFTYPNGDEVQIISITFACRVIGGELHIHDDESLAFGYYAQDNLPSPLLEHHRIRIEHAFQGASVTQFRREGEYRP